MEYDNRDGPLYDGHGMPSTKIVPDNVGLRKQVSNKDEFKTKHEKFDLLVFIGRMQPPHLGHKAVIDMALDKSKKVLDLLGSAGSAQTIRNPLTFPDRHNMIRMMYSKEENENIIIKPIYDKTYNDTAWIKQVQDVVKESVLDVVNEGGFRVNGLVDAKVGLIGAAKDHTSYYLKLFPQWDSVDVPLHNMIHATHIRESFLEGKLNRWEEQGNNLHKRVIDFLEDMVAYDPLYYELRSELEFVRNYKKQWESAPYPVKQVTCDAVVEQSGHILLVRRRSAPGKGKWAIPGGHLEVNERIMDGIIRELKEETLIKVPEAVLRGSVKNIHVFDDINRSTIGRVITHAAHFKLTDDVKLPKIKGSDDAEKAKWWPIDDIEEHMMFDDHFFIINFFLGVN